MFSTLQSKLQSAFRNITGKGGRLTEHDIDLALKSIRMALLEADVNFKVVKDFCIKIAEKAKNEAILKSLTPEQQIIKIVHEELVNTVGEGSVPLNINVAPPAIILMVGLQGSGKTTTSAKLARLLKTENKKKVLLVPADVYRPAAIEQLKILGADLGVEVYPSQVNELPVAISKDAVQYAKNHLFDVVVIDTAGRLQIDDTLMKEVRDIVHSINPHEILLVADAMTGQEAVSVAKGFNDNLEITGLVLTKLDGDARGGAALSMRAVTNKPIKFIGIGEKSENLEVFHPERLAGRILGMGDVLTLIEKAQKQISNEEAEALHRKMKKNTFTLSDFLEQYRMMQRMGNMQSLLGMIPGMSSIADQVNSEDLEKESKRVEAIILSMTPAERDNHGIIDGSRRRRIAAGSGTNIQEVNRLLKMFTQMKGVMSQMAKGNMGKMMSMLGMKMPKGAKVK
jgi:signal recognition particle subunit SRP54